MDIEKLYIDYRIPIAPSEHRHSRPGWVNTSCPFCTGNPGYHLGYDNTGDKFVCWRCGGHGTLYTISNLLKIPIDKARDILQQYGALTVSKSQPKHKPRKKPFKLPENTGKLMPSHIWYLEKRGFDPEYLKEKFFIKGTGPYAPLKLKDKTLDYRHRIVIPFVWDSKVVSFDSRDITEKASNKYQACPEELETIGHKDILYCNEEIFKYDTTVCVEGPTDVWRLGTRSFATSGIKYKRSQVRLMAKLFKRIAVLYDDDPQAILQANKLVADLRFRGIDAFRVDIKGDPGALTQIEADYLIKQLIH